MGYSRYGHQGKGLSDRAQQSYNRAKRATLTSGYNKYLFDKSSMLYINPTTGKETFKGMYQLPNSPKFAGGKGSFEAPGASTAQGVLGIVTGYPGGRDTNTFGIDPSGNRGMPGWLIRMMGGEKQYDRDTSEEVDKRKKVITLGALGILAYKVLL